MLFALDLRLRAAAIPRLQRAGSSSDTSSLHLFAESSTRRQPHRPHELKPWRPSESPRSSDGMSSTTYKGISRSTTSVPTQSRAPSAASQSPDRFRGDATSFYTIIDAQTRRKQLASRRRGRKSVLLRAGPGGHLAHDSFLCTAGDGPPAWATGPNFSRSRRWCPSHDPAKITTSRSARPRSFRLRCHPLYELRRRQGSRGRPWTDFFPPGWASGSTSIPRCSSRIGATR